MHLKVNLVSTTSAVLRGELKLPDIKRSFQKDIVDTIASISSDDRNIAIVESDAYKIVGNGDSKAIDCAVRN